MSQFTDAIRDRASSRKEPVAQQPAPPGGELSVIADKIVRGPNAGKVVIQFFDTTNPSLKYPVIRSTMKLETWQKYFPDCPVDLRKCDGPQGLPNGAVGKWRIFYTLSEKTTQKNTQYKDITKVVTIK